MIHKLFRHPIARRARWAVNAVVIICAVILAVAFVTSVTVDLGPVLKARAESAASAFMRRPMHIGRLSVYLWRGSFSLENVVIEGLTPKSRPFLTAARIELSMPWTTLFTRRVVFDAIQMSDWRMYVEMFPDGRHNFPRVTPEGPRRQTAWTTTLEYVRAFRGEFTYEDHGTPWSTVARNLEVTVARPTSEYRGQARFSNGTVSIKDYVPMQAEMSTSFRIVGGKIVLDRIDLLTDGTRSQLTGQVDTGRWPEQLYHVRSQIEFPRMREVFFARDRFSLFGSGEFEGTFHLFRETVNGSSRVGRELQGMFYSPLFGVNDYRFTDLLGQVRWVPETLEVTKASAGVYGGQGQFEYRMAPLGKPDVRATVALDATYESVDLSTFADVMEVRGIRLSGRASGRNLLQWPLGRYAEHSGEGEVRLEPPPGADVLTSRLAADAASLERLSRQTAAGPRTALQPVPVAGTVSYAFGPEWIELRPSDVATPGTYMRFEGRTAYGENSSIPFHVTSADWQESDRILAGLMTAFGSPTRAVQIGGYGTFDGVMLDSFRRPRIEGTFAGERMRVWDVEWGSARGAVAIENSYVDVKNTSISSGRSTIQVDGRFSAGYPRRDGGEELNARLRLVNRPMADLRHAFDLDDYPIDGLASGEVHLYGNYQRPYGFGTMEIAEGVAYGEPFDRATAGLRLEGIGVRLDTIEITKGSGRGTGAAYVEWDGVYSFQLDARRIPVETIGRTKSPGPALSGLLDFSAGGSGTFDLPKYAVRGTIRDLFVGDEGIGQVVATADVNGQSMTLQLEAASPRLAVSGTGRIELTPQMYAELAFSVSDTSLDPYVRAFEPRLSPYTTAVASGTVKVVGELADIDHLLVDATVDEFALSLFDYQLRNQGPLRLALDRHSVRLTDVHLVGEDTELDLTGTVNLHDERIAVRAGGVANLGILQGFVQNIRSSGRMSIQAALEGPLSNPAVNGTMTLENGRLRHFALPHALENVSGVARFDTSGITLDELTGRLGGGPVEFGGRIGIDGYQLGRLDVTLSGQSMRLRFPEGMRSLVDAELALDGTVDSATLSGDVTVRSAVYTRRFEAGSGLLDLTGGVERAAAPLETTVPLRYDVRVLAPSTLRVENNTVRIVSNADLQLRGTYDRPLIFGRLEIERGEVTFEGRRYVVARGTVDFNNPTRIEPFFDVETETQVRVPGQTYRITVRAAGTLERLTPEFAADPPLPEVEVLSLLFGDVAPGRDVELRQYTTTITPQQQLLRERAARALTGALSAEVGRIAEQTFGVDTFQLTPLLVDPNTQSSRLDPAARLTIGKRLSNRIYLTYSRSLSSSTRDQIILLEDDQTDRFSWILSRNEDRTYALDVRVRHAF